MLCCLDRLACVGRGPVRGRHVITLLLLVSVLLPSTAVPQARPGVPPADAWTCPVAQPIKGNFTPSSGERCIYHVPGGRFYGKTKPERCYASDDDARRDGCRKSKV
jgi:hypothetical protein